VLVELPIHTLQNRLGWEPPYCRAGENREMSVLTYAILLQQGKRQLLSAKSLNKPGTPAVRRHSVEGGSRMKDGGGKIWFALSLFAFLASFGIATALGLMKPYTNWDMIAYVGAAISYQESDPEAIHQKTFRDVQQGVSSRWCKEIAATNARSNNAKHFVQNLPFYMAKPAYVAAIWLARAVGLTQTYSEATWVVAALSFAGLAILLLSWQPELMNRALWLLVLAIFCWFGNHPLSTLARFSTPDSMAMIPIFGAFLALLRLRRPRLGIVLMSVAVLIRPETAILAVMTAAICLLMEKSLSPLNRMQSAIMGISSVILYILIQKLSGNYGYEKFFYYTFVSGIPNPAEVEVHLVLKDYSQALLLGFKNIFTDSRLLPFLVLSAVAAYFHFLRRPARSLYAWLLLLAWGNYVVRFLLVPSWQEYRYYSTNYLLILIASCEMISPYFSRKGAKASKR
jgi:hypothetical protein